MSDFHRRLEAINLQDAGAFGYALARGVHENNNDMKAEAARRLWTMWQAVFPECAGSYSTFERLAEEAAAQAPWRRSRET